MSSDLLRRAAETLRQHAQAATPGPWEYEHDSEAMFARVKSRSKFAYAWQGEVAEVHTPDKEWPDFKLIALLGPPVALALADLLYREAIHQDAMRYAERETRIEEGSLDGPHEAAALALARAILRESQP